MRHRELCDTTGIPPLRVLAGLTIGAKQMKWLPDALTSPLIEWIEESQPSTATNTTPHPPTTTAAVEDVAMGDVEGSKEPQCEEPVAGSVSDVAEGSNPKRALQTSPA